MSLHDVTIIAADHGPHVALSGEIDMAAVESVHAQIRPVLDEEPALLVLDLRDVAFLDSSGLRLIFTVAREQSDRGARMVVVRGGRRVARVLELTGADRQLETVDDPAEIRV